MMTVPVCCETRPRARSEPASIKVAISSALSSFLFFTVYSSRRLVEPTGFPEARSGPSVPHGSACVPRGGQTDIQGHFKESIPVWAPFMRPGGDTRVRLLLSCWNGPSPGWACGKHPGGTVSRTRRDLTPGFITPPLTVHRLVEDLTKRRRQKSPRRARTANTTNPGTLQCFHRRESCVLEKTSSAPPMLGGGSVSWEAGQPRGAALGGEAPHLTPSGCGLPVHPNPAPCTRGALISLTGWGALWEPGGAHESSPAVRVGSEDMHPEDPRHRPGFPEAGGALLAPPRHRAQGSPESPKVTVVRGKAEIQSEVCLIPKPRSLLWELPAPPSPGPQRWP
ncbi:uncharacterized protein LOC116663317 isoform X2 [Camelus ferus]|uniref:Uncharacterized protein LOC116663317 isoform X2 n=1 Tax=Camelus ferus TaxID=419612 RepID=A0A8B8SY52_CAMFR|nr:uncharacterized protein LOC116663317 isoform X2 [Camelus ferus]